MRQIVREAKKTNFKQFQNIDRPKEEPKSPVEKPQVKADTPPPEPVKKEESKPKIELKKVPKLKEPKVEVKK